VGQEQCLSITLVAAVPEREMSQVIGIAGCELLQTLTQTDQRGAHRTLRGRVCYRITTELDCVVAAWLLRRRYLITDGT
jgi:hypothetical protein